MKLTTTMLVFVWAGAWLAFTPSVLAQTTATLTTLHGFGKRYNAARLVLFLGLLLCGLPALKAADAPVFSQFIVFGDSLSDSGNDANVSKSDYDVTFPGDDFNYTTGRFTDGVNTNPASTVYKGVWHEQLARLFFGLPAAVNSLNGGMDYAYGGATTENGTAALSLSSDIAGHRGVSITVDNMGAQVSDYLHHLNLNKKQADPEALYIVWGGADDLFDDGTSTNGIAAADRETALIKRLAEAGAVTFLVPNLPPLGSTPDYEDHDSKVITEAAVAFNNELNSDLDELGFSLSAEGIIVNIYRLDVFGLFDELLLNHYAYGFTNITDSAQGMNVKADEYLFWDGVHPTTAGHYQLACEAYSLITNIPVVTLAATIPEVATGSGKAAEFTLSISAAQSSDVVVKYAIKGSAVNGTDYKLLSGTEKIKAGKMSEPIKIIPKGDLGGASQKTVLLSLVPGHGYTVDTKSEVKVKIVQ